MAEDDVLCKPQEVDVLVCTTCRHGLDLSDDGERPGARLHRALAAATWPEGVTVRPVECLSNCSAGCSVVVRGGPKRWTYVYGNLDPASQVETIVEGVSKYLGTKNGLVPWRERPEHFRKNCVARVPPLEVDDVA
ncbi:MAG: DUF1636 family protein [Marinibacterium sp.]